MQDFEYKLLEDGTYCVMRYTGDEANVVIPDTVGKARVTILNDGLFQGHTEMMSIQIPDSVTDFGEFVFDGCVNLHQMQLPSQLKHLWGLTFVRSGLEEVTLPDSLVSLPPFAFKDCKQLKKVVCGSGLRRIGAWVFGGCDQLEEVLYGSKVEVSPYAFSQKE